LKVTHIYAFIADPVMKIVGVLPSLAFIRYLIQSHVFQTGVMTLGRPEFYFVMTPAHYFVSVFQSMDLGIYLH
jgi:hypothetical protein